jgi:rubrerythrin
MEIKEALDTLKNTSEAIRKVQSEYSVVKYQNEKLLQYESKFKTADAYNKALIEERNKYKRYFKLLEGASNHKICPECDGLGGIEYQVGEFEMDYDPCKGCNESGIVPNTGA